MDHKEHKELSFEIVDCRLQIADLRGHREWS